MNILIQEHAEINLLPMMSCIAENIKELNVSVFGQEVNVSKILSQGQPDLIFFHGDSINNNIYELLVNGRCVLFEHEYPGVKNEVSLGQKKFSLVDINHDRYFPPACNTSILKNAKENARFKTDISFIGPHTQGSLWKLSTFINIDSDISFRIYGENRVNNWRYCGVVQESDVKDIYKNSKIVPVFNNELEYNFRVLDCIFCNGVPLVEHNERLIQHFGKPVADLMFLGPQDIEEKAVKLIKNRERVLDQLKPVKRKIIDEFTQHSVVSELLRLAGLNKTADRIEDGRDK